MCRAPTCGVACDAAWRLCRLCRRGRLIPVEGRQAVLDAPRSDVRRGVPAGHAGDLHDVAGVRRVDEGAAADVDAHVTESVEEDEVAGLELVAGDGCAHPVLRVRAVRQRDPDLGEHVHDQAGAVETRGRCATPAVGHTQIALGDRNDARMRRRRCGPGRGRGRRRRRRGDRVCGRGRTRERLGRRLLLLGRYSGRQLPPELRLSRGLLRFQMRDLPPDRGEQRPAGRELALDRRPLGGPLADERCSFSLRVLEPGLSSLHLVVEAGDLGEHVRVLRRDPVRRVEAIDEVVEARRAEEHLERVALAVRGVQLNEASREGRLSLLQALLRDPELGVIRLQVGANVVQLDGREVVGLDGTLKARVEALNLVQDALRLGLLRGDRGVADGRGSHERCCKAQGDDCRRRTFNRAANTLANNSGRWARSAPREGPVSHKCGTLATPSDGRKPHGKPQSHHLKAINAGAQGRLLGSRVVRGASITRRARLLTLATSSVLAVSVALPASGAGSGSSSSLRTQAGQLREENSGIASRSRAAVLTLYALDSRLTRAEAQLSSLRSQAAAVERRRAETRGELAVAKQVFAASQRNLANRLRAAYEQGDSDTLAIALGAKTLDDALSALEKAKAAETTDP